MELQEAINTCRENGYRVEKIIAIDYSLKLSKKTISQEGIAGIIKRVSHHSGLNEDEIHINTRKRRIKDARQLAHYIARKHTSMSLFDIGWEIGKKDHATVLHSIRKITDLLKYDSSFCKTYDTVITIYGLKDESNS